MKFPLSIIRPAPDRSQGIALAYLARHLQHERARADIGPNLLSFNPQLRVEVRGAAETSDAELLSSHESDESGGNMNALRSRSPAACPRSPAVSPPPRTPEPRWSRGHSFVYVQGCILGP